jgi:hypothetical protein
MGRRPIHESATISAVVTTFGNHDFPFASERAENRKCTSFLEYVVDPRGTREAHEVDSDLRGGLYSTTAIDT